MDIHYAVGRGAHGAIHLVRVHVGWFSGLTGTSVCGVRTLEVLSSVRGQAELRADQHMCQKCVQYVDLGAPRQDHDSAEHPTDVPTPEHALVRVGRTVLAEDRPNGWVDQWVAVCKCGWESEPTVMAGPHRALGTRLIDAHRADLILDEVMAQSEPVQEHVIVVAPVTRTGVSPTLWQATCSCGHYLSTPGSESSVRYAGAAHAEWRTRQAADRLVFETQLARDVGEGLIGFLSSKGYKIIRES